MLPCAPFAVCSSWKWLMMISLPVTSGFKESHAAPNTGKEGRMGEGIFPVHCFHVLELFLLCQALNCYLEMHRLLAVDGPWCPRVQQCTIWEQLAFGNSVPASRKVLWLWMDNLSLLPAVRSSRAAGAKSTVEGKECGSVGFACMVISLCSYVLHFSNTQTPL